MAVQLPPEILYHIVDFVFNDYLDEVIPSRPPTTAAHQPATGEGADPDTVTAEPISLPVEKRIEVANTFDFNLRDLDNPMKQLLAATMQIRQVCLKVLSDGLKCNLNEEGIWSLSSNPWRLIETARNIYHRLNTPLLRYDGMLQSITQSAALRTYVLEGMLRRLLESMEQLCAAQNGQPGLRSSMLRVCHIKTCERAISMMCTMHICVQGLPGYALKPIYARCMRTSLDIIFAATIPYCLTSVPYMLNLLLVPERPADEETWQVMEIGRKIDGSNTQPMDERILLDATQSLSNFQNLCPFMKEGSMKMEVVAKRAREYLTNALALLQAIVDFDMPAEFIHRWEAPQTSAREMLKSLQDCLQQIPEEPAFHPQTNKGKFGPRDPALGSPPEA